MNMVHRLGGLRAQRFFIIVGLLLLFSPAPVPAQEQGQEGEIPKPINYVSDYAGVIDDATEAYLNGLLRELEEKTTAEIAVLTVETTAPLDSFSYGMAVFDRWRIGKEGKDNGLLFLVAVEDRWMHIFTGYGLEGILPDGKVGEIRDTEIFPRFRDGDYAGGIKRGVELLAGIIAQDAGVELVRLGLGEVGVSPEPEVSPDRDFGKTLIVFLILFFLLYFLFRRRARARRGPSPSPWPWIFWWGWGLGRGRFGLGPGSSSFGFGGGFSRGGFGGFGGGMSGGGGAGGRW